MKSSLKMIGVTCVVTLLFSPLLKIVLGILPEYYSHYLGSSEFSTDNLANYIDILIKAAFILLAVFTGYSNQVNDRAISNKTKQVTVVDIYMNFMIASLCIAILATRASILDRMEQYFWIFSIFSISNTIKYRKNKDRSLIYLLVSSATIIYNITLLVMRPEWNKIVPYLFFWR